jgi:integrase
MKYSCTFYLDKEKNGFCPINASVTFAGVRLRYYIGYRIQKEKFVSFNDEFGTRYQAKKNSIGLEGKTAVKYNAINDRLQAITVELSTLLQSAKEAPDKRLIIDKLNTVCNKVESLKEVVVDTFWETTDRFIETTNVTPASRKQLKSALKRFKTYEETLHYNFTFDNINGETLTAFEQWLKDGTRGRNSIASILKRIQRFFSWAIKDQKLKEIEITITNPFTNFTITPEMYGTPVVLEKAERDYLFNLPLDNDRLKKIRDIFIFQCYCGARISDLMKLTTNNLHGDILKYVPQKTAKESIKEVVIPLNKKAIQILKRYNEPEGYLLPRMSDTEINRTLKTLFKTVGKDRPNGLDRPVGHLNPKTEIIEYVPLHELASTHLARRTFAGLMYAAGQKDDIIASMTGHSENSKAFTRYRAIDMDLKKKATKNQ